jgi:hypothetical protein
MKKVIEGKVYNTASATELGSRSYGTNLRDFHYVSESLYVTKNGAFFIAGEGGALSKYSESLGQNSYSSGSGMSVLDATAALACAESFDLDVDIIEKYFTVTEG